MSPIGNISLFYSIQGKNYEETFFYYIAISYVSGIFECMAESVQFFSESILFEFVSTKKKDPCVVLR